MCTVEWFPSIYAVRTKLIMLSKCNKKNNNEMDLIHKEGQGERLFFYNCILCDFIICSFSSRGNAIVQVLRLLKRNDRICTLVETTTKKRWKHARRCDLNIFFSLKKYFVSRQVWGLKCKENENFRKKFELYDDGPKFLAKLP